jgi:DNA-binding HxlR family transcriptional regulator
MLIQQLRELERDGLVIRTVHPEVPPRVDYQLSAVGLALKPALATQSRWASISKSSSAKN